ncbi:hypothetical protein PJP07_31365, partial [Mycobacterium kansasii]
LFKIVAFQKVMPIIFSFFFFGEVINFIKRQPKGKEYSSKPQENKKNKTPQGTSVFSSAHSIAKTLRSISR